MWRLSNLPKSSQHSSPAAPRAARPPVRPAQQTVLAPLVSGFSLCIIRSPSNSWRTSAAIKTLPLRGALGGPSASSAGKAFSSLVESTIRVVLFWQRLPPVSCQILCRELLPAHGLPRTPGGVLARPSKASLPNCEDMLHSPSGPSPSGSAADSANFRSGHVFRCHLTNREPRVLPLR